MPELRFPEFTDTWKTDLIGNIGSFTKGAGLSKADITENGTPFILYGELYTTYGDVIYDIKRKTDKTVPEECYSKVGDVIIPTSGETPEEIATSACVMVPDVILAGDLNILRSSNIDGRFLSYLINHVANKSIAKIAQGKSVVHIQAKEISKIAINFPSSAEQLRIVNLLEFLDLKISKQKELIENLKLYKRGALQQIFSNNHNCKPLKEITSYVSSSLTLSSLKDEPLGVYPVYDASGISQYIDSFQIENKYIAIIKDGSGVGKLQLCKSQSSIIGTLGAIVSKELPIEYIYAFMQTIDFKQFVTGMAIPHIYYKDYSEIKVPIPDIATINKIVNIFNGIDLTIIAEENKYNYMMDLKQGLLQKMFI